jgi:hypothetical protein
MRARVVGFALVPVGDPPLTFPAHAPNRKRGGITSFGEAGGKSLRFYAHFGELVDIAG